MKVRSLRAAVAALLIAPVLLALPSSAANAVTAADWDPGYIISDGDFFDGGAMTADQVQAFLNGKVPACNAGSTCLKDYRQATPSIAANPYCAAYVGSPDESAAEIITKVGMACHLSQKAILVTLQKEQGLVTSTSPSTSKLNKAMGYGCPDSALCSGEWAGFFLQVYFAAKQLQRYGDPSTSFTWYPVGTWTPVRYSPNAACGADPVFIRNRATAALYYYTPYQPNAAALANMPGTGDGCSAYGNRNFWYFYWNWFRDPHTSGVTTVNAVSPGYGPLAGGTHVTITGADLTGVTSVTFDGVAATDIAGVSDSAITVTSPPGTSETAAVIVTTGSGASFPFPFAYLDRSVVATVPARIADVGSFSPGVVRCYAVTGRAGVPVGATGVVLNVTASLPTAPGHVRVYPDYLNNGASPPPAVSTVNFEKARDVANSAMVALPTDGKVCAYSVGGSLSRLILDVEGYTLPGSGITLTTPAKLIDTRSEAGYHTGPIAGPVEPMTDYEVQVTGNAGVPAGATAVVANVTVVDTKSPGHLRMWASDQAMPDTSVVNYAPETKANSQIIALSADGKLTFRSFSYVATTTSPVQVLIDVTGYIAAGSDFVATVPTKIVETRPAYGVVGPIPGALTPGVVYPVGVDTSVVPAGATAVVLNVTAVQPTNFGHIRVYPDTNGLGTTTPPNASNLNFIPGRDIPNMVIVKLPADRTIDLYTAYAGTGRTDLVVNIIGYIAAPV